MAIISLIDEAVRSILLTDSTVYNIVITRIHPIHLPLACTFPAISYSFPSDPYTRCVRSARCQIDCWAEDLVQCKTLKLAVEAALDGFSGTVLGIDIEGIFPIDPRDLDEPDVPGLVHIAYDFDVIYRH